MHFYSEKNKKHLEEYLGVKPEPAEYEILLWEKVSQYNYYFSKIPWILWIAVCNSLAMNSAHKDSDIDLFIITKNNRLWTVRILMTIFLTLTWERKTSKNHAGKFCLSFFITEDALNFENIAIRDDIYLAYWIDNLKPIINRKNIFSVFYNENAELLGKNKEIDQKIVEHPLLKTSLLLTFCWDFCEKLIKWVFFSRTKKSFQKLWKPFGVIISDDMLKFHNKDRRKEIRDSIISS